jgi:DNA-binding LacI/PurR family transcriptional regulator
MVADMRVTLKNVANELGISISAISQVLNNHPNAMTLCAETREKILETVKRMGYHRNENAAMTRTGITKTVALITDHFHPGMDDACAPQILYGLLNSASSAGYNIRVYNTMKVEKMRDELLRYSTQFCVCFSFSKEFQRSIGMFCRKYGINLCYIQESCFPGYPIVYTDDSSAVCDAVRKLYGEGFRRIAFLRPDDECNFSVARLDGYLKGLTECGLRRNDSLISSRRDERGHYPDIERMLKLPAKKRPEAFLCTDDIRAMRVQMVQLKLGIATKIVGFGDTIAKDFLIPVDTIAQPFAEIGAASLEIVTSAPETWKPLYLFPAEYKDYGTLRQGGSTTPGGKGAEQCF